MSSTGGVGETNASPAKVQDPKIIAAIEDFENKRVSAEFHEMDIDENVERVIPSIKNTGATMRSTNTLNLYQRPGTIENQSLLQKQNCMLLKPNLIEHHDFVALPFSIWKYIFAWYSCDWSIVRFLRKDSAQGVILDLYPNPQSGILRTENETPRDGPDTDR